MRAKTFALVGLLLLVGACGSRNIYKNTPLETPPPLERGYVYMTHTGIMDAGVGPVEFNTPVVTPDSVFVASQKRGLEAFERSTFRRKWRFMVKNGVPGDPLFNDNTIYFGANDGNFYAVDGDLGRVIWKYETKAPVFARATVDGKHIYIPASDDVLYCLDQSTGKWIWHYKRGTTFATTVHGNSTPAVADGVVYVGFSDGYIVALNAKDGNLKWEQRIHKGTKFTDVDASPVIENDRIYIPSYDGELYALRRRDGSVIWHIDVGGSKKVLLDPRDKTTLYLASSNGHIYSVNKDTGHINWTFELDQGTPTNLLLRKDYLVFGSSQQYFYAIHKGDGSLAYRFNVGLRSGFFSSPTQLDDKVYIFSNFGNLYVFRWANAQRERQRL